MGGGAVTREGRVAGILQPGYLPWLGFFEQICRSEVFVLLDDVQYDKHGWRNRNRIKTARGPLWLTVPVEVSLREKPLIRDVKIDNRQPWRRKHLAGIRQNYSGARYLGEYIGLFEEAFSREWEYLVDLDHHFITTLCAALGMEGRELRRSSELETGSGRSEKLIGICRTLGADSFYEGAAGRNYIDEEEFARAGIRVRFQDYRHPVYRQLHGEFVPYLSVIDLLLNHGTESLAILKGAHEREETI
jgi:hypothetical protein